MIRDQPLSRPLKSPVNFDWNSEYGLFVKGADLSKQKNYSEAEEYLMKALEKNPDLVACPDADGTDQVQAGIVRRSRQFAGQALAINTYDPGS